MNLHDFIEKWICPNTLIRLWKYDPKSGGHILISIGKPLMSWEIGKLSKYGQCEVVGVTDILCSTYPESVNIVIKEN